MTTYDAVGIAEGFVEAESEEQVIEAWQYIYDNKLHLGLQGWFSRAVSELLKQRIIK